MSSFLEKIKKLSAESAVTWGADYHLFAKVIEDKKLKVGVEIEVAFGGHSEAILKNSTIDKLYGVDPYCHIAGYEDPMNWPQDEFDQLYQFTVERLAPFSERYQHIRKPSKEAVDAINGEVDFVYIDADHSYEGVWEDLCTWFPRVRVGGIIGGHDFNHSGFPGVEQAVKEFFRRFEWEIHEEGNHVWWVEKRGLNVSFIIPAYNCEKTVAESVESIMEGNFESGDEIIIVNDGSTDNTADILNALKNKYSTIIVLHHIYNKGGGAARNTAAEHANNQILFCLDSDNILEHSSITRLKVFMLDTGSDIAAFQELRYFSGSKDMITHKWIFKEGQTTLADYLSGCVVPGASGNYMFTKESWIRAQGYPEFAGALDAWGFGLRQVATGHKMMVMPASYYYHRFGHESYWVRESKKGMTSLTALQILIPFHDQISENDVDYMMNKEGRYNWLENLDKRPIRLKSGIIGKTGMTIGIDGKPVIPENCTDDNISILSSVKDLIIKIKQQYLKIN